MTCRECPAATSRLYCSKRCANRATQRRRTARHRAEVAVVDDPLLVPWAQVGAALGVTGRRAQQIGDAALAKLRLAMGAT